MDDALRECAGMLRRRMPAGTVLGVLAVGTAVAVFAAQDPTVLAIASALAGAVWLVKSRRLRRALAAGGLKLRNRARRRERGFHA